RIVGSELFVRRLVAVCPPVALVGAAVGVEHDHAMIEISVGDVDLVGLGIDLGVGRLAQASEVVAVGLVALLADLQHEFALARELQILAVLLAVAADPDEALVVDAHAVLVLRPVVAGSWTVPGLPSLPSWSNSMTGGAGAQHLLVGGLSVAAFSSLVRLFGRWITQTWSRASTATPAAWPMIQLLGRVCGHDGSTWKRGMSLAKAAGVAKAMADSKIAVFMFCSRWPTRFPCGH